MVVEVVVVEVVMSGDSSGSDNCSAALAVGRN